MRAAVGATSALSLERLSDLNLARSVAPRPPGEAAEAGAVR